VIRGSFLVAGSTCHIEAHLDDVENTVHEPSDEVQGELGDFFQLIDALAMKIASRLNLTPEAQLGIPAAPSPPGLDLFPRSCTSSLRILLEPENPVRYSHSPAG
jgi:hypothetical protein